MKKCPRCGKEPAIVDITLGILPGEKCQEDDLKISIVEKPEFYNLTKIHRVQAQRDSHNKDMIQPFAGKNGDKPNPDFVKSYPEQSKNYFTPEQLSKL